ncbi:MAG: T9SS type A sorting domain-containing protein [Bacteroidales bacterium]|nr:T9SS type A sorting domain-containing protein [Bacteroidales bacterium]
MGFILKLMRRFVCVLVLLMSIGMDLAQAQTVECYERDTVRESFQMCANGEGVLWRKEVLMRTDSTYYVYDTIAVTDSLCDSILVYEGRLTILPLPRDTITDQYTICANSTSVLWRDSIWMSKDSTYYLYDTIISSGEGCDSIMVYEGVLTIFPLPVTHISGEDSICDGDVTTLTASGDYSFRWRGLLVTGAITSSVTVWQSGTYIVSAVDEHLCTGNDTITVVVSPSPKVEIYDTVCAYGPYVLGDSSYSESGVYVQKLATEAGCDSVATLYLKINELPDLQVSGIEIFCEGDEMCITASGGTRYEWSTGEDSNVLCVTHGGEYVVTSYTSEGCAKSDTLSVPAYPSYDEHVFDGICDGDIYLFYGQDVTRAGNYQHIEPTQDGCDSSVTLHLSITDQESVSISMHAQDSFPWAGRWLTQSGIYTDHAIGAYGCDSMTTLYLTIIHKQPLPKILMFDERLLMVDLSGTYVDDDGISWDGYAAYQWYKNGKKMKGETKEYYHLENMSVLSGCFYVEVATDETMEEWVTSDTICVNYVGIEEIEQDAIQVWPNPVSQGDRIMVRGCDGGRIELYNLMGRKLTESTCIQGVEVNSSLQSGAYMMKVTARSGRSWTKKVIIK